MYLFIGFVGFYRVKKKGSMNSRENSTLLYKLGQFEKNTKQMVY